jgi:hypothetical protein
MERFFLARGGCHIVERMPAHPNYVLKTPNFWESLFMRLFRHNPRLLRNDLKHYQELLRDSPVKIPDTKVFVFGNNYCILQEFVKPDNSVDIIKQVVLEQGIPILRHKVVDSPENFISSRGHVYWIDPIKGAYSRGVERYLGIPWERKAQVEHFVIQPILMLKKYLKKF